ncbi:unnamed protein product [Brachionus calyciflorus]|uniref:Tetraspanin n=1 Tax=Brachionus calyciflorus TaxID=104777 RepID=A0A813SR37_9BILA|nr:unnamed protein product [Brachionus calyciflorus]
MEVSVKPKILKICLKFLNLSLVLSGLLACLSGLVYFYIYMFKEYEFTSLISIKCFSSTLILSGIVALVLGGCGIGLLTEKSRFFNIAFSFFIFILLILCMSLGMIGILSKSKIEITIKNNMASDFKSYSEEMDTKQTRRINWLQKEYQCCGMNSSQDWSHDINENIQAWLVENKVSGSIFDVPDSCCINNIKTCGKRYLKEESLIYTRGILFGLFIQRLMKKWHSSDEWHRCS